MKFVPFVLFILALCLGPAQCQELESLELVESWPIQTDFDQSDIRDTKQVWLELIDGAQSEILWQTFYIAHKPGKATDDILKALERAAARGVDIKFLVDEKFYGTYPETLDQLHNTPGIEVRLSPVGRWLGGVMHAKTLLVDGKHGFLGSQNIDWRSFDHIRELGMLFRDPSLVRDFREVFFWEWDNYRQLEPPKDLPRVYAFHRPIAGHRVTATVSPNALNWDPKLGDEFQILQLLGSARKNIKIALLSYSPVTRDGKSFYPELDNAIRQAAVRGVKVQLLLSHWVEKKDTLDHLLSLDELDNVEVRACRIPLTDEGEIPFARVHHSKYLVVDGAQAWMGTANWAKGYFHQSRNFGLVLRGERIPKRLGELFSFDWQRSSELKAKLQR